MNEIRQNHEGVERQKEGISSFDLVDTELIFKELNLKEADSMLDIGCGAGDYSIKASRIIGDSGIVYALDQWEEVAAKLLEKSISQGIKNIKTLTHDITKTFPIADNICNICFISMVLHGIDLEVCGKTLFDEITRILKPSGRLAIIEIKNEETPFGPPLNIRLSLNDIENYLGKHSFEKISTIDLESCYMIQFRVKK